MSVQNGFAVGGYRQADKRPVGEGPNVKDLVRRKFEECNSLGTALEINEVYSLLR